MRERKVRSLTQIYETSVQILKPKDSSATHDKFCKRGELKEHYVYQKSSFQTRKSESILLEEHRHLKIPKSCFLHCPNRCTCNYMQKASSDRSHILSICSSHDPLSENADSKSVVEAVSTSGNVATHHIQLITRTFNHEKKESDCLDDDRSCISGSDGQKLRSNDKNAISNCKKEYPCCCLEHVESTSTTGKVSIMNPHMHVVTDHMKSRFDDMGVGYEIAKSYEHEIMEQCHISKPHLAKPDKKAEVFEFDVKVCDICGDIGIESSLATCSRCNDGAEHIYCMRIMKNRIPEGNWLCEDCVLHDKNEKWKEIDLLKNASSASTQLSAVQMPTQSLGTTAREKGPSLEVVDGLVIHPVENVSFQTESPTINVHRGEEQIDFIVSASVNTSSMYSSFYPGIVSNVEGTYSSRIATSVPYKSSNSFHAQNCGMTEKSHVVHNNESVGQLRVVKTCAPGRDFQEDPHTQGHPTFSACMPVPEMQYIWKGGFLVLVNRKLPPNFDQIQAHLSASASHKVTEVVNKFPNIIALEEVSISSVWSDKLLGNHAMENNIALYFFAQSYDNYRRNYQQFLECMIKYDLALKACLDGTDLFIFSSSLLPEKSNCWNCLYFLWGVLRERMTNSPEQASVQAINHGFNEAPLHPNRFPSRMTHESLPFGLVNVNKDPIFNSCFTGVCSCDASSDTNDVIYQSKTSSPVHNFFTTEERIHDPRVHRGGCHFNARSTCVMTALCIDLEAQRSTSLEYKHNEQYKLIHKEVDDEHPSLDLSLSLGWR